MVQATTESSRLLPEADYLGDPLNDRQMKDVKTPPQKQLSTRRAFANGQCNTQLIKTWIKEGGTLSKSCISSLLLWAKQLMKKEPNLVRIDGAIGVVGDIHGQLYDMFYMLEQVYSNSRGIEKLVFMGDYVDRGMYGPEVVAYLCAMKIEQRQNVVLLRGNHETRECTSNFNFRHQCIQNYDSEVYENFMEFFDTLPVAAVVNGKFFCVHGGIMPGLEKIENINKLNREQEPEDSTILSDMLWADPMSENKAMGNIEFTQNTSRGTSFKFGRRPLDRLLQRSNLQTMLRAHEVQKKGYKFHMCRQNGEPRCITIFSAPNYCGQYGNKGAIFCSMPNAMDILTFEETQLKPVVLTLPSGIDDSRGRPIMNEKVDAISYFMDELIGHTTQAFLGMLGLGQSRVDDQASTDTAYLRKVAMASIGCNNRKNSHQNAQERLQLVNQIVDAEEERIRNMTSQDRSRIALDSMEDSLGIDFLDINAFNPDKDMSTSIHVAKTASQQLLDDAKQRIRPRESIEGSDRANPTLVSINRTLSDQLESNIKRIPKNDPQYSKLVQECYDKYSEDRFTNANKHDQINEAKQRH